MKSLPSPESTVDRHGNWTATTPYTTLNWTDIVSKYGIQLPEIVDMTLGKSICHECKAVYVGYQPTCSREVPYHRMKGVWHDQRGHHHAAERNFEKQCTGWLIWDLQSAFNTQVQFFSLLERIRLLPEVQENPLDKFKDSFPAGVSEVLNSRLLVQDVNNIKMELYQVKEAIKTIASKMNQAGGCLSFGF